MPVSVQLAADRQSELTWLIQQYQAELGQSDPTNGGRAAERELVMALAHPTAKQYVIMEEQQPVGFAIISQHSRIRDSFDGHSMLALYILPNFRRLGYGRAAATSLFDTYPGTWEIATFGTNIPGISFWRSVADSYTGGRYHETWTQNAQWRGSIQVFSAPGTTGDFEI